MKQFRLIVCIYYYYYYCISYYYMKIEGPAYNLYFGSSFVTTDWCWLFRMLALSVAAK